MIEVRDRIGDGINRQRLELEAKRGARPLVTVVLGLLLGLAVAGYIATNVSRTLLSDNKEYTFAVEDATGVVEGTNEVRVKGIAAGTITNVSMEGTRAVLTAKVQKKYGTLYRDAEAQLRPNTALQDMYLDITDRGTPAAGKLEAGTPLAAAQTDTAVSVNDVLNVFNAPVRVRLATLLDELGNGMADRGVRLRTAFAEIAPTLDQLGRITDQLAERAPMVRRLVRNTGLLTQTLSQRQTELNTLVRDGSATLTTLKDGRGDLADTLEALPPTLGTIDTSFAAVRGVLGDVDQAVRTLGPVSAELPEALQALRRLNRSAAPAVRALQDPVGRLVPLSAALRPLSANLSSAVQALAPQIDSINKTTANLADCKKGVVGFFQWNASISKLGDQRGAFPRGNLVVGAQSSSVLNDPSEFAPQACTAGKIIGGRPAKPQDGH